MNAEAKRRLDALKDDQAKQFQLRSAKLRNGSKMGDPDKFMVALNSLIRRYMQRFGDFFTEEVTYHQLASQTPLTGVFVHVTCDGELLHNHGRIGKAPPIMFRPWAVHPAGEVSAFKDELKKGTPVDSVALLEVRAKGFLERGATRSAIIEASAALELCITRKLRQGFAKLGKTSAEIDAILKGEINFKERANKLMNQATGKRVCDLDNTLYQTVLTHRDQYRHGIAHADVEPSEQDATQAVQDFGKLRVLVDTIVV